MNQPQVITPTPQQWDTYVQHAQGHLLQTSSWGQLKSAFGWHSERIALTNSAGDITCGAQVLYRPLPLRLGTIAYIPRGPVGPWDEALLSALDQRTKAQRAILLKFEPNEEDSPQAVTRLHAHGLQPSPHSIQPRRSLLVDLTPDEDTILANMNQKTRYNVRLAGKKDIVVRAGVTADLESFSRLMQTTGRRDGFGIHSTEYYRAAYDIYSSVGSVALLIASYEGKDLAALMAFTAGKSAAYLYGASSGEQRNRMPTYLLQWEAMRWAKEHGCIAYDMWGVPDADLDELETSFTNRSDGLWGVYRFKRGFGGRLVRSVGAWDKVYNPVLYALYKLAFRGGD